MSETKQVLDEQTQNGQPPRPDAIEVALDPLHVQKRGEILAGVLRSVEEQKERICLEQSFGEHDVTDPIPGYPEVNGHVTTFAERYREFDQGICRLKEKATVDVWDVAKRLYNDPAWEPQR